MKSLPELSIDTKTIYDYLMTIEQGEVIPYGVLSRLIGRNVQREAYPNMHSAVQKVLNDRKVFEAVYKVGLKRLTDEEIAQISGQQTISKMRRVVRRGAKKVSSADYKVLSNDGKIKHNTYLSVLGAVYLATKKKSLKMIESVVGKEYKVIPQTRVLELFVKKVG